MEKNRHRAATSKSLFVQGMPGLGSEGEQRFCGQRAILVENFAFGAAPVPSAVALLSTFSWSSRFAVLRRAPLGLPAQPSLFFRCSLFATSLLHYFSSSLIDNRPPTTENPSLLFLLTTEY